MKKEEFLKIFKMKELYDKEVKHIPFTYQFVDSMLSSGTSIIYYFYDKEISISLSSKEFSINKEDKKLYLVFKLENEELKLIKNKRDFKNEIFPHLNFEDTLDADLEFIAEIINDILIPKHNLKWNFSTIDY